MPSAAAVIIGDEILTGKFADLNTPWLIRRCQELGLDLRRVLIVPDTLESIAEEVARWSPRVDHVFTTGGVGPTHDDRTMQGIADAFGLRLVRHPELERLILDHFGPRATADALRMADVPEGAELWTEGDLFIPQVVVRNVCIFPGVPSLFQRKFDAVAHRFQGQRRQVRRLVTDVAEAEIAEDLRQVQGRFPQVAIGSYPQYDEKPWTVTVTVEGRDEIALSSAFAELEARLAELQRRLTALQAAQES